jgi:hypothetical protein
MKPSQQTAHLTYRPNFGARVSCTKCSTSTLVWHPHWSAIVCSGSNCQEVLRKVPLTEQELIGLFQHFEENGKWAVYGCAFDMMEKRKITLTRICEIAEEHAQINPGVVRMRRHDWIQSGR